jgi:DnaJ-class molecular chaperone
MSNPYDILGVSKEANDEEIKKAFRKRSLDLHPDRNADKDTTNEFQDLNSAFEKIKTFLRQKTILYNVDYSKPLYLATDASQVGMGSFLYQLDFYERSQEGRERCRSGSHKQ